MRLLKYALVRLLLLKSFVKALVRQVYIKLTKFTRRSRDTRGYYYKLAAGYDFVKYMLQYNAEVIQRSRRCLKQLAADNIHEVFVYGEKDVTEVLYDLAFEISVNVKTVSEAYNGSFKRGRNPVPSEMTRSGHTKIIVASLVNIEENVKRLMEWGVRAERIILLSDGR